MALYGVSFTAIYIAWDTSANAGKTGDVANHTLRWIKDGVSAAPSNAPAEVDATNAPGVYKVVITAVEAQAVFGTLCGKSSTASISIMPVYVAFEKLPNATPGANGGVPTVDASNKVAGVSGNVDGDVTGSVGSLVGHTVQSGDTYALANGASGFAVIKTDTAAILVDTGTTLNTHLLDIKGATFAGATDSLEAIRNRGDAAWVTATGFLDAAVWTNARAGYLDNLNIGQKVAGTSEVTSIQNNTRVVRVVPTVIERPDSGTTTYRIELLLYDTAGNMEVPDVPPIIALVNQGGTDLSSRLGSTTMTFISSGRYRAVYTASSADALEQLVWTFSVDEGGVTRLYGNSSLIVDTTAVDFTSGDRTKLEAVYNDWADGGRLDLILDDVPTTSEFNARTLLAADYFDPVGDTVANVTLVATTTTNADMRGTDLANTTVPDAAGTAASLHSTTNGLITTVDTVVDAIKVVTDALPDSGALTTIGANAARLTAARAGVLDDWINTGRLDTLLDAVKAKTDNLPGATLAELPQGVLPATPSLEEAVMILYMTIRNKLTVTSSEKGFYNDAGTKIAKKALSDDGTTYTEAEAISGA